MTEYTLPSLLEKAYETKKIRDINGNLEDFHSGINREEAEMLIRVIKENKAVKTWK